MAPRLALHFLGPPQLYLDDYPITIDRRKAVALLAYLAVQGVKYTRDSLSALLWPAYEQANAMAMLQEIMVTAEETGNTLSQFWVKLRLGNVALRSGNLTDAHQFFKDSAQGFAKDGYIIGAVFGLEGMAGLFAAVGKPAHAARLLGWTDMIRVKLNDLRPNIEQADVDKIITACLINMGEESFSRAYDEGQKMSMDQAVALALNED